MEYTTLGATGMRISRICLGTMSFSHDGADWKVDDKQATAIVERAIDHGVNFFDTANVYSRGESEEVLGAALAGYDRDWSVVATKCFGEMDPDNPNARGLSRKAIEQELANSLDRLGMGAVDLYQTHRYDYETGIETTLRALDDAVRRGHVREIGASSMRAIEFAEALYASERLGLGRFASMQNHYNLVYREEEREMLPLCAREDVGVLPWSPLGRGFLARPHAEHASTVRGELDAAGRGSRIATYRNGGGEAINERVEELAAQHGVSMAQIGLAWLLHQDVVDAPIVGVTSLDHLDEAVEAVEISLSSGDLDYLEEPYEPVPVDGLRRHNP